MWPDVAGCGVDVTGCGRMWLDVAGCGWMWLDVVGCGWMWLDVAGHRILRLVSLFQIAIIQEEEFYNLSDEQKQNIVTMEFESDVHTESVCVHYVC